MKDNCHCQNNNFDNVGNQYQRCSCDANFWCVVGVTCPENLTCPKYPICPTCPKCQTEQR